MGYCTALSRYVRVWLPGKDRIFEASVMVNRDQAVSPKFLRPSEQRPCAVKTADFRPTGASGQNYAGQKTLRNTNCNGNKNMNDDGSCCEPTASTVSNAVARSVVCCSDKNPFTPTCSSGATANLAAGSLGMVAAKRGGTAPFVVTRIIDEVLSGASETLTGAAAAAKMSQFWCNPQCVAVVDLGGVYDVSSIKLVAKGRWNAQAGTFDASLDLIAKYGLYALALDAGSDLPRVPSKEATTSLLLGEKHAQSWRIVAEHTGNTHGMLHALGSPVKTRYLKLVVADNGGRENQRVGLQSLTVTGCDPDGSKTLVPHLRGEPDPGYTYGNALKPEQLKDTTNYPFARCPTTHTHHHHHHSTAHTRTRARKHTHTHTHTHIRPFILSFLCPFLLIGIACRSFVHRAHTFSVPLFPPLSA